MAEIILNGKTAYVKDFIGFTPEWDEILLPVDREAVRKLIEEGYTIEYSSDEI